MPPRAGFRAAVRSARRLSSPPRARTCRCPRSRPCRRRTVPWGSRPRSPRTRADGPRRGRRGAAGPARAARPSAPPNSRARRPAPGGSRSGAAARRGAGRRRSAPCRASSRRTAPVSSWGPASCGTRAAPPRGLACLTRGLLCTAALPLLLCPLDRLAERGHQVDDLVLLLRLRLRQLPALRLRTDEVEELLAVGVGVLLGLERLAEVLHERPGHLHLGLLEPRRADVAVELSRVPHLVRVVHGLEEQEVVVGAQAGEVLLVADDDLRDPDLAGLGERANEQAVRLLRALRRQEVVGLAVVDRVDLVERDEVADVDRVRELDVEPVEILVADLDVAALLDLEAADDVVGVDRLAVVAPHLLVGDRRHVLLVQEVEAELLRLGRREHPHADADEAERDGAAPDRAHALGLPEAGRGENVGARRFTT